MDKVEKLIVSYVPLAKSIAKRYPSLPYEDRVQEALLGLTIAANMYDPEKGAFGPYASVAIRNRLTHMLGKHLAETKDAKTLPFSSFEFDGEADSFVNNIADQGDPFGAVEAALVLNEVVSKMPAQNIAILRMKTIRKKQSEISAVIGISQPSVSRILGQMREEMERAIAG